MAAGLGIADLHAAPGVIRAVSPVRWLCKREHDVAVLAAFALLHADEHPLAVDIRDLE